MGQIITQRRDGKVFIEMDGDSLDMWMTLMECSAEEIVGRIVKLPEDSLPRMAADACEEILASTEAIIDEMHKTENMIVGIDDPMDFFHKEPGQGGA